MWKTLACLVGSMTGTAALLGWLDPSKPINSNARRDDEVARLAQEIVVDGVDIKSGRWFNVEIAAGLPRTTGRFLAAQPASRDYHFYIDRDGVPTRSTLWPAQKMLFLAPQTVRIEVAQAGDGDPMTPAQWVSLRALLVALSDTVGGGSPLSVYLKDEWEQIYGTVDG